MTPILLLAAAICAQAASADLPLYEQEPFDRITLNEANDGTVLDVEPLDLPGRRLPEKPKSTDKLRVHLLSRLGDEYEVAWQDIAKVELFEQMVLAEAQRLTAQGELEKAYDYYAYLEKQDPELPGLAEAMEAYLYEEAKAAHRAGRFDRALAMLRETYRRNPKREGLEKALGMATVQQIEHYAGGHDYAAVRSLLSNLAELFPEHEVVVQWKAQLVRQAEQSLAEAREAVSQQRFGDAAKSCRNVMALWPDLPGARELAEQIHAGYPRVVVAVTTVASHAEPSSLFDWNARRSGRLQYRTLVELVGAGTDGAQYACPLGQLTLEPLQRQLVFQIEPGIGWAGRTETLTGYDVSRQLLWPVDRWGGADRSVGDHLVAQVDVRDVYRVEVDLLRVPLRPERWLQKIVPPVTWSGPPGRFPANGSYSPADGGVEGATFTANDGYFGRQAGQPAEIVELALEPHQAVAALRAGRIDIIDRVAPWTLPEVQDDALKDDAVVAIQPYAFPLVHCLVPSPRGALVSRRSFRRALVYGIDRQRILTQLLHKRELPGCEVADGPFPGGYARDPEVTPRPYDPRLAIVLADLARRELTAAKSRTPEAAGEAKSSDQTVPAAEAKAADAPKPAGKAEAEVPGGNATDTETPLVLAYPPDAVARAACTMIKRHCAAVGIGVEPRVLTSEETAVLEQGRFPEGVDLLYVELAVWEPVVDAARLFGPGGLCSHGSPYLQLGLRRLADAADWSAARAALTAIHRAVYDETTVIPLWQLTEYMAYRRDLGGVAARPVTLYQNVEDWRPSFRYPSP